MTNFKLDVSFNSERGTVQLHVFDLDAETDGPLQTCGVGAELNSEELRRAWGQFWEDSTPTDAGESLFGSMDDLGREPLPERDEE